MPVAESIVGKRKLVVALISERQASFQVATLIERTMSPSSLLYALSIESDFARG